MMKIHYHSDCAFFAGSENMLVSFFASERLRSLADISFSYRSSQRYEQGLRQRVRQDLPVYPLEFADPEAMSPYPAGHWRHTLAVLWRQLAYYPLLLREVWTLYGFLRRIQPDVLHINNGGYPAALSCRAMAIAGKAAGVKHIVMVVNNLAVAYDRPTRWMDYPVDRLVVWAVERFVTGSASAGKRLADVLRLGSGSVRAIHNGIITRAAVASRDETRQRLGLTGFQGVVFGIVALLEPRKGHAALIEAVAQLAHRQNGATEIKLLIEGSGLGEEELRGLIATHGLNDVVHLVGDEQHVFDFMAAMDVLVLSSLRDEDFPNVIIEAMSLGRPVIASRLAGTPEQVDDGVTGLLVEPGSIEGLAAAMEKLSEDDELRRRMGASAKVRFDANFTSDAAVERYCALYGELTGSNLDRLKK